MINKVILVGNLGKDPEIKHFDGNSSVAKFTVATNETYRDKNNEMQKVTEWHNVVVWNGLAGVAEQYLKKGQLVYVEGKLTTRKWQDSEGKDRWSTEVVGRTMKMLGGRDSGGSGFANNMPSEQDAPPKVQQATPVASQNTSPPANSAPAEKVAESADDDLPF